MANNSTSNPDDPHPNSRPPPLGPSTGSTPNVPFTPRSASFPYDFESDSEFDAYQPTPTTSPGGPVFEDLPPTYDEAQQQALDDARAGRQPLNPSDLEVHRLVLNDHQSPPPGNNQPQTQSTPEVWEHRDDGYPLENRRNADGLGMTVPVQQVQSVEQIPVGAISPTEDPPISAPPPFESSNTAPDPTDVLLRRALDFTKHEPDPDVRYAPRLTRRVAIPLTTIAPSDRDLHQLRGRGRGRGRHGGCGRHERRGRDSVRQQIPGQWPESASSEAINTTAEPDGVEEPANFLRAYAKSLHAHSIRPAEFTEFLDGLNALCAATNTTSTDLARQGGGINAPSQVVVNYIDATNEAFFGPRGLRVSFQSLSMLINAINIPEQRGQRAGAIASALDNRSSGEQRSQALHPYIEVLETDVPEPSSHIILLREISERYRRQVYGALNSSNDINTPRDPEKARLAADTDDPPHSIPQPQPSGHHGAPSSRGPFGGGWGRGGHHNHRGRGWGGGHGPWGPPPHHGHHGHHGHPGRGGFGMGGRPFNPLTALPGVPPIPAIPRGPDGNRNDWAAWGESWGKWGEEVGKKWGDWGSQFGRRAEDWGTGVGRRANSFGQGVNNTFNGRSDYNAQGRGENSGQETGPVGPEALHGQETGVDRGESTSSRINLEDNDASKPTTQSTSQPVKAMKTKKEEDDDDDSSDSSSSSSDSEDEDEFPDTHEIFIQRVLDINTLAESQRAKGKKPADQIAREREQAIEKAQSDRTAMELKIEQKREKRQIKKDLRRKKRELKKEHRRIKRELKALHGENGGKGRKKDKARKLEKRQQKEEYRAQKRELREVKREVKREWMGMKDEYRKGRRDGWGAAGEVGAADAMVWVVVENLGS